MVVDVSVCLVSLIDCGYEDASVFGGLFVRELLSTCNHFYFG